MSITKDYYSTLGRDPPSHPPLVAEFAEALRSYGIRHYQISVRHEPHRTDDYRAYFDQSVVGEDRLWAVIGHLGNIAAAHGVFFTAINHRLSPQALARLYIKMYQCKACATAAKPWVVYQTIGTGIVSLIGPSVQRYHT